MDRLGGSHRRAARHRATGMLLLMVGARVRAGRLPARPEQPGLEHPRRRLRRRGRRRPAADGRRPTGTCRPTTGTPCAGRYANGDPIGYVQTNGRCESPIDKRRHLRAGRVRGVHAVRRGVRLERALGRLPAAHVAASAFDLLAIAGLFVAGWRLGSRRLGVLLAFAWAANPFTLYALNMNTNDALVGALVAWMHRGAVGPGGARRAAGGGRPDQARPAGAGAAAACRCAAASRRWPGSPSARSCCWGCSRSSRRRLALLGPHHRLPAGPGDAALDLDARHVPPRLVGSALAAAGGAVRGRVVRGVARRVPPRTARTPPPWRHLPARS